MKIKVDGADKEAARELEDAANFYGRILLHPRTFKNINLDIEVNPSIGHMGQCLLEDDCRSPRYFTIQIRGLEEDDDLARTLAHEMTHLQQYATNRLRKVSVVHKGMSISVENEWEGKIWKPKKRDDPYFDSPWEIEAYGREAGLYHRWVLMYNLLNYTCNNPVDLF